MHEVEEPARPHPFADVHPAAMEPLQPAGHHAALDQRDRRVDQQRVERQVPVAAQCFEHCLRDRAHPHLHRRAVGYEAGDVAADRALDLADRRRRVGRQRLVDLDPAVDLAAVEEGVAERARHLWIHLRDHQRRAARRRQRDAHRDPEAQVAARVGGGAVDEHAVGRPHAAGDELGHQVEVARGHELDAPAPPRVVEARRHVPRRDAQRSVLGPREGIVAEVDAAQQREIFQSLGLPADLGDERDRLAARRRQQHLHRRPESGDGVDERAESERARHESRGYIYPIPR